MDSKTLRKVLHDAAREIEFHSDDNSEINRILESVIRKVTGAELSLIWMNEYPRLICEHTEGIRELSLEKERGLLYRCFRTKQPAYYNALGSEKDYDPQSDNPVSLPVQSGIFIPILLGSEQLIGIVACYSLIWTAKRYTDEDLERFKELSPLITDGIIKMQENRGNKITSGTIEKTAETQKSRIADRKAGESTGGQNDPDRISKLLDTTAAFVHDIRTPANGLAGFLDLLYEQIREPRIRDYIAHARESAELINELTTSILDNIAGRQIQQSSHSTWVKTPDFFAEIGKIFSAKMYEKRIDYAIYIDPHLPEMFFLEAMKLKRVLMNLLGNAVKFTPENGSIEYSVEYRPEEYSFRCQVKDSGIGIPKERQKDIFKPFTQVDDSIRANYGGSGLGLTLSAEFVEEMGGELRLESAAGQGSRFYFDLPIKGQRGVPPLEPLSDKELEIGILAPAKQHVAVSNILRYLEAFGIPAVRIRRLERPEEIVASLSHLLLFEHFLDPDLLRRYNEQGVTPLIVEERFLSLDRSRLAGSAGLISCYDYYGTTLHHYLHS